MPGTSQGVDTAWGQDRVMRGAGPEPSVAARRTVPGSTTLSRVTVPWPLAVLSHRSAWDGSALESTSVVQAPPDPAEPAVAPSVAASVGAWVAAVASAPGLAVCVGAAEAGSAVSQRSVTGVADRVSQSVRPVTDR